MGWSSLISYVILSVLRLAIVVLRLDYVWSPTVVACCLSRHCLYIVKYLFGQQYEIKLRVASQSFPHNICISSLCVYFMHSRPHSVSNISPV